MSVLFATVAVVCTMSACNDYVIDTAENKYEADTNFELKKDEFLSVWDDDKKLTDWLIHYQIGETIFEIVSLDIGTQEIKSDDIP